MTGKKIGGKLVRSGVVWTRAKVSAQSIVEGAGLGAIQSVEGNQQIQQGDEMTNADRKSGQGRGPKKLRRLRREFRWALKNMDNYLAKPPSKRAESMRMLGRENISVLLRLKKMVEILLMGGNADNLTTELQMELVQVRFQLRRRPGHDGACLIRSKRDFNGKKVAELAAKNLRN